jgi:hypothetical protein
MRRAFHLLSTPYPLATLILSAARRAKSKYAAAAPLWRLAPILS